MAKPPCERCGQPCRTEKLVYGWVCAECAHELDAYYVIALGLTGGSITPERYAYDRSAGILPTPGARRRTGSVKGGRSPSRSDAKRS